MDSEQRDRLKILVKERDAKAAIESARRHGLEPPEPDDLHRSTSK